MQIGEQHLTVAQHPALDRLRLLDLDDHVGAREHVRGRADDGRAGALVIVVGGADAGAGARLDQRPRGRARPSRAPTTASVPTRYS